MNARFLLLAVLVLGLCPAARAQGDIKKGSAAFAQHHCIDCHPGGSNIINPRRPLKGPGFQSRYPSDAALIARIRQGTTGTGMPPFSKDELPDAQMLHLIAYVRSLSPAKSGAAKLPPGSKEKLPAGKTVSVTTTTTTTTTKVTVTTSKVTSKAVKTR